MIFDGWIRRKLESLLLPWLVEEPEWEVKLGFLCSTVVARKLNFDVVALNRLVEGGGLVLKSVVVEEVSIRIAYWSAPAFTIEVQGVHVTLSAEKRLDQRGDGAVAIPIDDSPEEKKKILAQIDPEGSTLHDNLGKIMLNCTRTRLKDSIINLAMMHCWLHLHNVHLQVEVPVSESEGSFRCLWDTKELNVGCPLKHGCFLGRFISLLFLPMRESSFNIESRRLEVGFEREDHIGHTFICTEPYIGVKLKDFCLIDFELSIPDMEFSFSPNEISTVRVFSNVFFVEHKRCRNGRQLWRMARLKFGTLFPSRKSFYDVAIVAVLWLRLVKAYQNFLMLVGYSLAKSSHNAVISIANNGYFPRSVKQKWDLISKIEEQLPVEAISSARRVARYKAGTKMQCAKDGPDLAVTSLRIPAFLEVTWRIVLKVFEIIKVTFLLKKLSSKVVESEVVSEVSNPRVCFSVTLERISVMLSPVDAVRPSEHPKTNPRSSDSYMDLVSFRLLLKECLFVYEEGFCKQYLSFSMACVEVASLCKSAGSGKGNSLRRTSSSLNEEQTKGIYESRTVIWGDAAPSFNYVEESGANLLSDESEGEIWLIWKKLRTRFQGRREQYTKKPFLLCENRSLWVYPGLKSPDRGFWTCCFTMGKLNVSLGHPSLLSIAVLVGQVYFAAYHCECSGTSTIHSHSPMTANNFTDLKCRSRFESSAKHMKVKLLKLLPDQHVALKAVIAGPRLQFSPRNVEYWRDNQMNLVAGQDGVNLTVDIHDIELAVRPSSRSDSGLSPFYPRLNDADADFFKLEERNLDSTSGLSNEDYACKGQISLCHYLRIDGLNAFFKHSEENRQTQILLLKPLTLESLSSRDYQYSFGTTSVAMSLAFNGVMRGVSAFLYVDELSIIIQEVEELFSMVSRYAFGSCLNSHPYVEHEALQTEPINEEKIMEKTEERDLNLQSTFLMNITFEVGPLHIILHSYRKSNEIRSPPRKFDAYRSKKLGLQEFPDLGVWVSSKTAFLEISAGEGKAKFHAVFSGFQVMTFTYKSHVGKETDLLEVENVVLKSLDCIHEISLSSCTFTMLVDCSDDTSLVGVSGADNVTSGNNLKGLLVNLPSTSDDEMIKLKSIQEKGFFSDISALTQSHWLRVNIGIDVIFMGSCSVKNVLVGLHHPNRTMFSLSIGGDIQKICMGIQGGFIIVEPIAVLMFAHCFTSYLPHLRRLFSVHLSRGKPSEPGENLPVSRTRHVKEPAQRNFNADQLVKLEVLELLIVNFSQLSLVLLEADDSGGFKEIVGRIDIYLVLGLENRRRKFLLDLSDLNILSQILNEGQKQAAENIQIPHFASARSSGASPLSVHENTVTTVQDNDVSASSSSRVSAEQYGANDSVSKDIHGNYQNCILERLTAFVTAEKPLSEDVIGHYYSSQGWAGSGCISGLNMTISLPEIQVFTDMVESLSAIFGKDSSDNAEEGLLSLTNPEPENDMEEIPDGAIVAIQDVDQHMWITVECVENKYKLVGAPHHSLAGKKALFRVRYHRQRWNFAKSRFSLISLHAKSDSGEPLRLNYRSRSAFVDISSTNDSAWALWSAISCKRESFKGSENYEGDIGLEFRHRLCKNTFYLLNKKSDCAVAFLDGSLEFVKEPGNPFKFKVFDESSLAHDLAMPDSRLSEADTEKVSDTVEVAPCIKLTVNKVSLTIVTERSEAKDKLPLLRGCINDTDVIVQNLPSKTRVIISMLTVLLHYFDGHRLLWRDLVHPFEICIYFRSKHHSQVAEASKHGASVRLYIRMEELDVMLTELSLDIILYVIGKLDLAGPFAVKNSALLANSCKVLSPPSPLRNGVDMLVLVFIACMWWQVENLSGLYLLFHFYDAQSGRVGRRQSAFFFLRPLADQPLEASYVSVKLDTSGTYSTSAIHIPLSESRIFAWRTRVVSSGNGRTYPGPFIVFDISKNSAEGLSIVVSPLIRIHNRTDFLMELHFQRPEQKEDESASVFLEKGDTIDDCMAAFDAVNLSGGSRKAVTSLSVGNFIFSFRPEIREDVRNSKKSYSADWSNTLEGGKAVRLSGIIDKLNYKVRKVLSVESWECSFSIARCSLRSEGSHVANMHFLVQIISRDVPVMQPSGDFLSKNLTLALQKQKEIFLLPTIRVSNLVQSDILVLLTERDTHSNEGLENVGNEATIPCGSSVDLYANPAIIYFTITLVEFGLSCKPVNCEQWVKKLNKKKDGLQYLDIDLDFYGGKCFACLRLVRDDRGILEAVIFTPYKLKNDTDFTLFFRTQKMKSLSRDEIDRYSPSTHPYHGSLLPPKSIQSWYLRSFKLLVKLMDDEAASDTLLDLDALSGFTEISLAKEVSGFRELAKLGVSLGPLTSQMSVPSQIVSIVPRYVVANESDERIFVRQCFLEDDVEGIIGINSGEKIALLLRDGSYKKRDVNVLDKLLQKHRVFNDDSSIFVQFKTNEMGLGWSGPVCVASLGRFFLKFKKSPESVILQSDVSTSYTAWEFAVIHVIEEASTLVLHFRIPPDVCLPYRIENHLCDASITYYQKDTYEPESLGAGCSVDYAWDDLTKPHKLVVRINGFDMSREINLDKLRSWKPFSRVRQQRDLAYHLPFGSRIVDERRINPDQQNVMDMRKVGYEVYADGPTRVLRICEFRGSYKGDNSFHSCKKIQLRVAKFAVHLLEEEKQDSVKDLGSSNHSGYMPIVVGRLERISLDSIFIDQQKYNQITVQSISIDQKWVGAPFAAMLRRHQTSSIVAGNSLLSVFFVLYAGSSSVKQVKYSSIILQPVDLNLDEETLMKIVSFWRTSLSSNTKSQQYYFDHFEIHPVKIIATFLPEDSYSSYSSTQETLRSFLHSVVKIPTIKNMVVELNGVLVTHALVTTRELLIKCAQHYSWYAMRAIYIAKGSSLLPPTFASVFDDLASSSLDVFFDPSSSLLNVQGFTLGTFKLISKCIQKGSFSGTKRYFGDLGKTLRAAGSNILFAAVTEISDSVLKGAERSGFNGMVTGFHQGILKLAMEPSLLGTALMEGGPDRKIKLDRSPGVDELYIEGYLQAMLDMIYKQEYLRVRVIDNQVILKNLPPNSSLIDEIVDRVKDFLVSKALLKGDASTTSSPLRRLRGEHEWRIGPTVLTLSEHLFVSFAIRMLRKQTDNVVGKIKLRRKTDVGGKEERSKKEEKGRRWGIGKFVVSAMVAYLDGRLCRFIPHPLARRIVSGFLLSFLDKND